MILNKKISEETFVMNNCIRMKNKLLSLVKQTVLHDNISVKCLN